MLIFYAHTIRRVLHYLDLPPGMESTGLSNRIQVSQKTADLLVAAGKERYLMPRSDTVLAKGKGAMQTYWILPRSNKKRGSSSTASNESREEFDTFPASFGDNHNQASGKLM